MKKEIHCGKRPIAVFSVMFGVMAVPLFIAGLVTGDGGSLVASAFLLCCLAGFIISFRAEKLEVDEKGLVRKHFRTIKQSIKFSDFHFSVPIVLAEPEHPVGIGFYRINKPRSNRNDSDEPVARCIADIATKKFSKEDVQWLMKHPQMRMHRTKKDALDANK